MSRLTDRVRPRDPALASFGKAAAKSPPKVTVPPPAATAPRQPQPSPPPAAAPAPRAAQPKQLLTLRLDPDVIAAFKATGKGWQSRINAILKAERP